MTSHGKLSYQRDSWARLVFGSEFRSTPDDFNAKEFGLDDLMRALRSSEERVRMKAIVTLALRKDVPAKTLLSVGALVVDEDTQDYLFGRTKRPSCWVPEVSVCAEIFLPVIGQKSPEVVRKIISDVSIYHAYDKTVAIQTMVSIGVPSIAAALIARDPETVIALAYFKAAFAQEKGRITVKTEDQLVNAACIPHLIDRFLQDYDKRISAVVSYLSKGWLHEFIAGIIDSGDAAVPWLTEAIQYQTHPKFALELATKLGPNAVPALITALSNPKGDVQRANAYALSKVGKSSPAAVDALKTVVKRERGWWTRRAFRQYLKQIQKG